CDSYSSYALPRATFICAELLPWTFIANGLANAMNRLVSNANLIKKTYFPRLIVPISSVAGGLPDFALAFLILVGLMVVYNIYPTLASLLWLPLFLLLALVTSLGVGLWLAALNAQYRDGRYAVPLLVEFWMFARP